MEDNSPVPEINEKLTRSFVQITSSTREEAKLFLESLQWDLDAAVSAFLDNDATAPVAEPNVVSRSCQKLSPPTRTRSSNHRHNIPPSSPSLSHSPDYSPLDSSSSRSRSRSPSLPRVRFPLRSKREANYTSGRQTSKRRQLSGNVCSFVDLNRPSSGGADSDSDEAREYYTGGAKSGMLVEDPRKLRVVDKTFDEAMESPVTPSRLTSNGLTGTALLLSRETVVSASQGQEQNQPHFVTHTVTLWKNGFTVDDAPLRMLNDPENASFLESISRSECPRELESEDRKIRAHINFIRREENFVEPPKLKNLFNGFGSSLEASSSELTSAATAKHQASAAPLNSSWLPSVGFVVDPAKPTTLIKLRLADGTCLVSRFNIHHTIRDIRVFIDASRPSGSTDYLLLTMGFPLQQLPDFDQTIEKAGIANSVVIQKF